MKDNLVAIARRFFKAAYLALLIFGVIISFQQAYEARPYSYTQNDDPIVICDNGKTFNPRTKPIKIEDYEGGRLLGKPVFNSRQISSECQFGTAYRSEDPDLKSNNYQIEYPSHIVVVKTIKDTIVKGVVVFIIYNFLLELSRRTILYVLFGKRFLG